MPFLEKLCRPYRLFPLKADIEKGAIERSASNKRACSLRGGDGPHDLPAFILHEPPELLGDEEVVLDDQHACPGQFLPFTHEQTMRARPPVRNAKLFPALVGFWVMHNHPKDLHANCMHAPFHR